MADETNDKWSAKLGQRMVKKVQLTQDNNVLVERWYCEKHATMHTCNFGNGEKRHKICEYSDDE